MRKAAAPRYSGKIQKTTARFFRYMKTIFSGDPLRHTVNSQPAWTEEGKEKGPWRIWSECFLDRLFEGRREGSREEKRDRGRERRWRLCLWHHRENISHAVCLWAFITLVNARQTARDLPKSLGREGPHTHRLWRWSSTFQCDNWLSGWTFTTYVSPSGGMKDPHASDNMKSRFWQVSGAMSAVKCNEWPNWNRSQQADDRSTDKHKALETHGIQTWTQIHSIIQPV